MKKCCYLPGMMEWQIKLPKEGAGRSGKMWAQFFKFFHLSVCSEKVSD